MGSNLQLWIPELDVEFVRRQVCPKNITDQEFAWLIYLANQWKLDPMAREIYITKYGSGDDAKAQVFAGLAGFQKIANRSKQLDGSRTTTRRIDEPLDVSYTKWVNNNRTTQTYHRDWQYIGRAVVHKKGCAHPFVVEVQESEYSTGRDLWTSKPQTMIKKVALCQALRMAFGISGLYDRDEMGEDAPPDAPVIGTVTTQSTPLKRLGAPAPADVLEGEIVQEAVPVERKATRPAPVEAEAAPRLDPAVKAAMKRYADAATEAGHATKAAQRAYAEAHSGGRPLEALSVADWDVLAGSVMRAFMDGPVTWTDTLPAMADAEQGGAT